MPQVKSKTSTASRKGTTATKNRTSSNSRTASSNKKTAVSTRKSGHSKTSSKSSSEDRNLLQKFFVDALKDIYWAEKHLTKALPKMSKATTNEELKSAIDEHLTVTEGQIERLEQVFEMIGQKAQAKKCEAMAGLTKEAESIIEETEKGTNTRDVGIIMAAQKVEHYEIATYGGLVQLAKTMGMDEVAELLGQTLEEEKETDENLTQVAENSINLQAETESEEGTEEDDEDEAED
jgi:ferritin-like metal-binding protein YciE